MRKIKISVTILFLYEFVILTILQIPHFCFDFFSVNFCTISYRYFLMAVVIPLSIGLLFWWGPEISRIFCKKCQCEVHKEKPVKEALNEIISKQDIERLITAAIIMGVQKFASSHPKTKETFDNILNVLQSENKKK